MNGNSYHTQKLPQYSHIASAITAAVYIGKIIPWVLFVRSASERRKRIYMIPYFRP
jgi:hypothetical protein